MCIQRYLDKIVDCGAHFLAKLPFKRLIERFPEAGQIPRRNRTKAMAEKKLPEAPRHCQFFPPPCFKTTKVVNLREVREVQEGATCFSDKKLSKLG